MNEKRNNNNNKNRRKRNGGMDVCVCVYVYIQNMMRSNGNRAQIHEIVHVWWPVFSILHLVIRYGIISFLLDFSSPITHFRYSYCIYIFVYTAHIGTIYTS